MRAISLFSGAGGMDAGFEAAGFTTVLACEKDRDAGASWKRNFGGTLHGCGVEELVPSLAPGMAAAVFGGPPCQGYSVAGRMDPHDPRSSLVFSFMDAVNAVRPEIFVMENVDALAALTKWKDVLAAIRERAAASGYATFVTIADAADFGVPQSRRRMFMWGSRSLGPEELERTVAARLREARAPRVPVRRVFEALGPAGTERNPSTAAAAITFAKRPVLRASPYAGMLFNGGGRPLNPDAPSHAMSASAGGNRTHIVDEMQVFGGARGFAETYREHLAAGGAPFEGTAPARLRRLTVLESAAIQSFPEGFAFEGTRSSVYRQIGNAVPCRLAAAVASAAMAAVTAGGAAKAA